MSGISSRLFCTHSAQWAGAVPMESEQSLQSSDNHSIGWLGLIAVQKSFIKPADIANQNVFFFSIKIWTKSPLLIVAFSEAEAGSHLGLYPRWVSEGTADREESADTVPERSTGRRPWACWGRGPIALVQEFSIPKPCWPEIWLHFDSILGLGVYGFFLSTPSPLALFLCDFDRRLRLKQHLLYILLNFSPMCSGVST